MIPYRIRNALRKLGVAVLVIALLVTVVALCWLLWLNRYVIYTRDGIVFDFGLGMEFPQGNPVTPPEPGESVDIYYNEGENTLLPENAALSQLAGVYVTADMLDTAKKFESAKQYLTTLPADIPIMLDVKHIHGEFYYTTALGSQSTVIDAAKMDALIKELNSSGHYLIARMPALRDFLYGKANVNDGIFRPNRYSLWQDEERCYWLHPAAEGTLTYLRQIITELKDVGFDEVVLTDFRVPDTNDIYFPEDRVKTINDLAASLVKICASDRFAVSFSNGSNSFVLPEGRSRLYLENIAAADAAQVAQQSGLTDADIRLVFLTPLMDTRFDDYSVMRPAQIA